MVGLKRMGIDVLMDEGGGTAKDFRSLRLLRIPSSLLRRGLGTPRGTEESGRNKTT